MRKEEGDGVMAKHLIKKIHEPNAVVTGFRSPEEVELFRSKTTFNKLLERIKTPDADKFENDDYSLIAGMKFPLNRKQNLLLGLRTEYSLFSVHKDYKLYNFNYGIEINYLIFSN